ncbi:MAG: hypothetical protein JWL71_63 [Acidobacteria bacterium]|nr:hypothetical protein [Acidobacteriota bacterium]
MACATCVVIVVCGCRAQPSLNDQARQYVRLAVALGERDPDALDFYAGAAEAVADIRRDPPPLATIKGGAERLSAQLRAHHDPDPVERIRVAALVRDLATIVARIDLLSGTRLRYDDESRAFFGAAPDPIDDARLAAVRSKIADLVGGSGRLVDRYAAFAARFTIPDERLQPVMTAAVDACRRATLPHVPLPPGEQVTLQYVRDKPWSAFSRYAGSGRSVIQINTGFRFTVDQALQVACHEGYPGHHTRNTLMTSARDIAGSWPERSVQLTFSPESFRSEAIAMVAADAAFSPEERLRVERERLFPLAGLDPAGVERHVAAERLAGELQIAQADVARRYLDGTLEFERAAAALEAQALVPHAEALVKYINQYRSYVTTYTVGGRDAAARFASCGGPHPADDTRWRCFTIELADR